MSYDRADWHYGGNYPKGLPPENGGTHIGMASSRVQEFKNGGCLLGLPAQIRKDGV
jgi:hypothetical protein